MQITRQRTSRQAPNLPSVAEIQDPILQRHITALQSALETIARTIPETILGEKPLLRIEIMLPRIEENNGVAKFYKAELLFQEGKEVFMTQPSPFKELEISTTTTGGAGTNTSTSILSGHSHQGYWDGGWIGSFSGS